VVLGAAAEEDAEAPHAMRSARLRGAERGAGEGAGGVGAESRRSKSSSSSSSLSSSLSSCSTTAMRARFPFAAALAGVLPPEEDRGRPVDDDDAGAPADTEGRRRPPAAAPVAAEATVSALRVWAVERWGSVREARAIVERGRSLYELLGGGK
jgi:hypothetical protein